MYTYYFDEKKNLQRDKGIFWKLVCDLSKKKSSHEDRYLISFENVAGINSIARNFSG